MKKNRPQREDRRAAAVMAVLSAALLALFLFSFVLGRYDVPVRDLVRILADGLLGREPQNNMEIAVRSVRLPRILLACLVGCCLSVSGSACQSVFRNPMASPDVLGAASGACFGAALAILLGATKSGIIVSAFASSLFTVGLVWLIGSRSHGSSVVGILLAGIMVSSLFSAGTSYIKLVADPSNQLPAITYWLMGSLSGVRMADVRFALLPMALGLAPLVALRWRINLLTLSEEEASAMGVNVRTLRSVTLFSAALLTAVCVSVSGMIGWVGLVIPQLCRKLVGSNTRRLIPASMLFGAFFLLLVDDVSRSLLSVEIPIGILTAFVGAPFFLYLMTRKENVL